MSQPSVSMDLASSTVLPAQTSVSRPGTDAARGEASRDFAAHLRQAGRDDEARSPRGVRGGAGSESRVRAEDGDDRTDRGDAATDAPAADATQNASTQNASTQSPSAPDASTQPARDAATNPPASPIAGSNDAATAAGQAVVATALAAGGPVQASAADPTAAAAGSAPDAASGTTTPAAQAAVAASDPAAAGAATEADGKPTTAGQHRAPSDRTDAGAVGSTDAAPTAAPASPTTDQVLSNATGSTATGLPTAAAALAPAANGHAGTGSGVVPTVSGVSASSATTATASASAPAAAPNTSHPGVAGQLAANLRTLAGREDGVHVMTVRLHPDDLGPVRVVARLTGNDVNLRVTTTTLAAAAAVTEAGPRLHEALAGSGLNATSVNVDHDASLAGQQSGPGAWGGATDARPDARPGSAQPAPGYPGSESAGGRHRLEVGPTVPHQRHPSARSLDLHV